MNILKKNHLRINSGMFVAVLVREEFDVQPERQMAQDLHLHGRLLFISSE